ncbi:MAG: enoyl-CoA hydratase/isomerase family protein [Candidatus Nanopelagicales bacterium]
MSGLEVDTAMLEQGRVRVSRDGSLVRVALDRPESRNAQTPSTWQALAAIGRAVHDAADDVAVVVVTGEGPSFSAGLDRRMFTPEGVPGEASLAQLAGLDARQADEWIAAAQSAFTWWREVPPITIAAVRGHAIGAGFQLALACDLLVAERDALFAMRETSYGLVPDLAGTSPLVQAVGYPRALEICMTGRMVDADEGYRLGFVTRVVDDLEVAVGALVDAAGAAPPGAVRALKPLLRDAPTRTPEAQRAAERAAQYDRLRALLAAWGG